MAIRSAFRPAACAWVPLLLGLVWHASPAAAQELPVKPAPAIDGAVPCPPEPAATRPAPTAMRQAERRAAEGTRALLMGDTESGLSLLAEAAELDPTASDVSYRLARLLDEAGRADDALEHYCRYLSLARDTPDAAEVRTRVRQLAATPARTPAPEAVRAFRAGIRALESGAPSAAADSFSAAIRSEPRWADAYYNRALAYGSAGEARASASDLRRYLDLASGAADRERVTAEIRRMRAASARSPRSTLVTGIALPGAAQFHTERPLAGAAVLTGVSGAVAIGILSRSVQVRCLELPEDGFCPPESVLERRVERPYLAPALLVAAAATAVAAWEGYRTALRQEAPSARGADGAPESGANLHLLRPRLAADHVGLRLEWLLRF